MRSDVTENKKSTLSGEKEGLVSRTYLCMDLKSFYASVECADRDLDPLTTNLVVADPSRDGEDHLSGGFSVSESVWNFRACQTL